MITTTLPSRSKPTGCFRFLTVSPIWEVPCNKATSTLFHSTQGCTAGKTGSPCSVSPLRSAWSPRSSAWPIWLSGEVDRAIREDGNFRHRHRDLDEAAGQMIGLRPDVAVSAGLLLLQAQRWAAGNSCSGSSEALSSEMGLAVSEGAFPR